MRDSTVTAVQLFSIGMGLGVSGLCFFSCAPLLLSFCAGRGGTWLASMKDAAVFLFGRLCAYVFLGAAAGMSSELFYRVTGAQFSAGSRTASSVLSICLGIFILVFSRDGQCGKRREYTGKAGLLLAGLAIGVSPCVPLFALLLEIMLISHDPFSAAGYALAFGAGTFIAGMAVFAVLTLLAVRLPLSLVSSSRVLAWVRTAAGFALIAMGVFPFIIR
jgi:hypothetical protein